MIASTLGGTLLRDAQGWHWSDGAREPRVRDLPVAAVHGYRIQAQGGTRYVVVPMGRAREEPELDWVRAGFAEGRYQRGPDVDAGLRRRELAGSDDHRVTGRDAVYVPIDDWDRWARSVVLGASWEAEDEAAILDRAKALGWTP